MPLLLVWQRVNWRQNYKKKAVIWGTVGAIGMRLVFATLLVEALTLIPLIHLGGGLVLVWIAFNS